MARSNLLAGDSHDIIASNIQTLKNAGYSHTRAVRCALCHSKASVKQRLSKISNKVANKVPSLKVKISPNSVINKALRGF